MANNPGPYNPHMARFHPYPPYSSFPSFPPQYAPMPPPMQFAELERQVSVLHAQLHAANGLIETTNHKVEAAKNQVKLDQQLIARLTKQVEQGEADLAREKKAVAEMSKTLTALEDAFAVYKKQSEGEKKRRDESIKSEETRCGTVTVLASLDKKGTQPTSLADSSNGNTRSLTLYAPSKAEMSDALAREVTNDIERLSLATASNASGVLSPKPDSSVVSNQRPSKFQHLFNTPHKHTAHSSTLGSPRTPRSAAIYGRSPPKFMISASSAPDNEGQQTVVTANGQRTPVGSFLNPTASDKPGKLVSLASIANKLGPNTILVPDTDHSAADFAKLFMTLWKKAEVFAQKYTNEPNALKDSSIDNPIMDHLTWAADGCSLPGLLKDSQTRQAFVMKVINSYLTRNVLWPTVFCGHDNIADSEILQILDMRFNDTPLVVRNLLVEAVRNQVNRMRNTGKLFDTWLLERMKTSNSELWKFLTPLITVADAEAPRDLLSIMFDAHNLAMEMYSGPYEFKFEYAKSGDRFIPSRMVDRDAVLGLGNSPTVRLSVTPIAWFRNTFSKGEAPMMLVHLGNVILRRPAT
ncbi:hypothetical protein AJ80_09548 [Polytolypa hystricis UAMH7299]|uniref:Uncharacterized protein n=1 Tax=Polytolypa hystricis (strain UAMH7299) TaxID=1447883 RepID=A0A2B7WNX8_POLH7|nr:hypothetical protein AJ80_09548 [Polytolypa hystricis UAMH7299]